MTAVGVIANPASGRDIRRLVAHGSVFDNDEKVSMVRRLLLGLAAVGVERISIMPDSFAIGPKALDGVHIAAEVCIEPMPVTFGQGDSTRAAARMADAGIGCIVTLGGDGTNRAVAKASGTVPLLPISTGTNNVFPVMVESTVAGMAAGLVARGMAPDAVRRLPRLDITVDGGGGDLALVDAAVYDERFVGARAVWDVAKIHQLVLTRAVPGAIGLSSIGAHLAPEIPGGWGLVLELGADGERVLAPVAPGVVTTVGVRLATPLPPDHPVSVVPPAACVLALDGERELPLRAGRPVHLRLNPAGPFVVDVNRALAIAAGAHLFSTDGLLP
jgi:hypothetical protein